MGNRYGKAIPFFEPFTKFVWYPASRCVFVQDTDILVSTDSFNMQQARVAARAYLSALEEEVSDETDHAIDQEGDA
jgi:hypothetical protein